MRITYIGIAIVIAGIAIFGFTLARLISGAAVEEQTKVPGAVSAEAKEAGRYFLWDNHRTTFEGERLEYSAKLAEDAEIVVRDSERNQLDFVRDASSSWSIGNNSKVSIGYVDVVKPTKLQFEIKQLARDRIVSVSNRSMKDELWARLGGLGIGLAVGLVGVLTTLIGLLTRRRARLAGNA